MRQMMGGPGRYIQGQGALDGFGEAVALFGRSVLVLASARGRTRVEAALRQSCQVAGCALQFLPFGGECCQREIDRAAGALRESGCQILAGAGGGKALDTAKAAAHRVGARAIMLPTTASTDAPCSALSDVYSEAGVFERCLFHPANPDVVLVDTGIIAAAPPRLLAAGMGDGLATWPEARACARAGAKNCLGGRPTAAALALARLCWETLLDQGQQALADVQAGRCTPAVEQVVEANIYLSGVGFESGGLAAAHSIQDALTALPEAQASYHGERVAFGTLAQLVLEQADQAELEAAYAFCEAVGLPTTLQALGLAGLSAERLEQVAVLACAPGEFMQNLPFPVTPHRLAQALREADALGRARRQAR